MANARSLSFSLRKFIQNQIDGKRGQFGEAVNVDTFEDADISDLTEDSGGVVVEFRDGSEFQIAIDRT